MIHNTEIEVGGRLIPASRSRKPLDLGTGRMAASIHENGLICSINVPSRRHGFITLSGLEPFPNDRWYDSDYVRRYRADMASSDRGFGLTLDFEPVRVSCHRDENTVTVVRENEQWRIDSSFSVNDTGDGSVLLQELKVTNLTSREGTVDLVMAGHLSLHRCGYGQLTEGGPITMPLVDNQLRVTDNLLTVSDASLEATCEVAFFDGACPQDFPTRAEQSEQPIRLDMAVPVSVPAQACRSYFCAYRVIDHSAGRPSVDSRPAPTLPSAWRVGDCPATGDTGHHWTDIVIQRNMGYILQSCAISLQEGEVCVITDHQLLPLSWNRDAYYMMRFVMAYDRTCEDAALAADVQAVVAGHLRWMFHRAERPNGYWGRAYLTHGYCKDDVFQLDQQCYPILELCDYYFQYHDRELVMELRSALLAAVDELDKYRADRTWLYRTGETPADDEVVYPYHFSSQVLVWHTLMQLDRLNRELHVSPGDYAEWAGHVRHDCLRYFTAEPNGRPLFAYLTDLEGRYQFYHDANDLPTVLAPVWGFVLASDPVWRNTLQFAFSTDNTGGYYSGTHGGLGSVHTPHKWPLGDAQELLFAWLTEDEPRRQSVMQQLRDTVQWDGMFPEAVCEHSGAVRSRTWFSWPGAFVAEVLLHTRSPEE